MAANKSESLSMDTAPKEPSNASQAAGTGTLIIIGGGEDKKETREILACVAEIARHKKILVSTLASSVAQDVWSDYRSAFRELGVKEVEHLNIPDRESAFEQAHTDALEGTSLIFFTGGDQLEITTKMGGTELCDAIQASFHRGIAVAGTSAGA